jgi:hypothetical protein
MMLYEKINMFCFSFVCFQQTDVEFVSMYNATDDRHEDHWTKDSSLKRILLGCIPFDQNRL